MHDTHIKLPDCMYLSRDKIGLIATPFVLSFYFLLALNTLAINSHSPSYVCIGLNRDEYPWRGDVIPQSSLP